MIFAEATVATHDIEGPLSTTGQTTHRLQFFVQNVCRQFGVGSVDTGRHISTEMHRLRFRSCRFMRDNLRYRWLLKVRRGVEAEIGRLSRGDNYGPGRRKLAKRQVCIQAVVLAAWDKAASLPPHQAQFPLAVRGRKMAQFKLSS